MGLHWSVVGANAARLAFVVFVAFAMPGGLALPSAIPRSTVPRHGLSALQHACSGIHPIKWSGAGFGAVHPTTMTNGVNKIQNAKRVVLHRVNVL